MITDASLDRDLLSRTVVVSERLETDVEAFPDDLNSQFTVAETKDGFLVFPEVVFRTLDDEDGDEGIWSILVSEG